MSLLILSINVNGLRDGNKRMAFLHWVKQLNADVICLQELHLVPSEAQAWFSSSGFNVLASPGTHRSCGVALLYRPSLTLVDSWMDDCGRFVMVELSNGGLGFRVANCYAPNRNPDRNLFFDSISPVLDPSVPTTICGDFNTVLDPSVDRRSSSLPSSYRESTKILKRLFSDMGVVDVWRHLHPHSSAFTWTKPDGSCASRIDLIGHPQAWLPSVSSSEIIACPYSDHDAVSLSFAIPETFPRGPGYWKLNTSILDDPEYIRLISTFWASWKDQQLSYHSLQSWWDMGKFKIKNLSIRFCSSRSKARNALRSELTARAATYKAQLDSGCVSILDDYKTVTAELATLDLEVAKGAQVRSRARWCEEGETSSAYFFRMEKKRGREGWISSIRLADGSVVSDLPGLLSGWSNFYHDLFTSVDTDVAMQEELLANLESVLDKGDADLCEGSLTVEEALTALKGMAHRKCPGYDGLPMEFYVRLWDVLGSDLVAVLNRAHQAGALSATQRRGVITLLYKKGDRLDMTNWRPITLLNVDYKIAARSVAGRLLKVIGKVVSPDQTCGIPGRYIGENVRLCCDAIAYANEHNVPLAVLSLDQEKAFDRVEWPFLLATLEKMGFGPSFIQWVKTFYTGTQSAIQVNGYLADFFSLSRGVRQGCPLSPLLYVLVVEVLAANIRASPDIQGLTLPGVAEPCVTSQYADDTTILVCTDESILQVFKIYEKFERASGAKLNPTKSKGLWAGSWRDRTDPPVPMKWSSESLHSLGVYMGNRNLDEDNWRPRIDSFDNVLASWRQRSLSLQGKALVSNALALSGLWYVSSLMTMPEWALQDINKSLFGFFWSGKRDLVARNVVCQPRSAGGFAVVNVAAKTQALHAQWIRRSVVSPSKWSSALSARTSSAFQVSLGEVLSNPSLYDLNELPSFYKSVISSWEALDGCFCPPKNALVWGPVQAPAVEMTCKACYQYLVQKSAKPAHCIGKFLPVFGPLYWPQTWSQVSICPLDRPVIDLNWKIAHGVLYTASRLASFGYAIDTSCFCGSPDETLFHLFFDCPLAQSAISWVQSLLLNACPVAPSLVLRHLLFGFNPDELLVVHPVFCYLLNVCKYQLWLARNDFRFRNIHPGAFEVIAAAKNRLKFILPLFFKRFQSRKRRRFFARAWGANNTLAKVVGSSLVFLL